MPSKLPSAGNPYSKSVDNFGVGPYDFPEGSFEHGEDNDETGETRGKALPDGGGSENPPTELLYDITASQSLPTESDNPAAHTGFHDPMSQVGHGVEHLWPDEDAGVYASDEIESLPTEAENDVSFDNLLNAIGNAWSGYTVQDQNVPTGFPSDKLFETSEYLKGEPKWDVNSQTLVSSDSRTMQGRPLPMIRKVALDIKLIGDLSAEFLKEFGKKDLTRRHVLAFLQDRGRPQYMASEIIRCLKLRHSVVVMDVMDQFPMRKASVSDHANIASIRNTIISMQVEQMHDPEVASSLGRCAANLAHVLAGLERLGS